MAFLGVGDGVAAAAVAGLDASRPLRSEPLAPVGKPSGTTLFRRLAPAETGIDVVHEFPPNGPMALLQDQGVGAGVCLGDFDGDGRADVFVSCYDRGNRLYRNLGRWRFEDVTAQAGVSAAGRWCGGVTAADIDNDGDLDLAVCVFNGPNLLFVNQGAGVFREEARDRGLDFSGASVMLAFADHDRDGDLDAYLVTHRLAVGTDYRLPANSRESLTRSILQLGPDRRPFVTTRYEELFGLMDKGGGRLELFIAGQRDRLYRNEGGGRFVDVTAAAGIAGRDIGLAATWWDYDGDGWPDLYVSNDYKGPDRLYRNRHDGTFVEVAAETLPHVPWSSMGADAADVNNDGWIDFLAADMAGSTPRRRAMILDDPGERWFLERSHPKQYPRNALYLGTGTTNVLEAAYLTGLAATDWTWSPKFADFDNDGWVDLFVANGMSRDFLNADLLGAMRERENRGWAKQPVLREPNLAFRNLGDLRFESIGAEWGVDPPTASFGAAVADLDRDGDLDLVTANLGEPLAVYRNEGTGGHRALIRLRGSRSNTWGIGALVRVESESGTRTRVLGLASGFMSANEPLVHFGLGTSPRLRRLDIHWPSGIHQRFADLEADRFFEITEPTSEAEPIADAEAAAVDPDPAWFRRVDPFGAAVHRTSDFDDFEREPLLPWRLSRLGPGIAVGDANGDGRDDVYLGGGSGQAGSLWVHTGDSGFRAVPQAVFELDRRATDMGALFLDADGDGDQDLFVVSGGVEAPVGDPALQDRLYLNDGKGNFGPEKSPQPSSGHPFPSDGRGNAEGDSAIDGPRAVSASVENAVHADSRAPDGTIPRSGDSGGAVAAADFDADGDLDLFVGTRCVPGRYPDSAPSRLWRNDGGRFLDVTASIAPDLMTGGLVTGAVWSDADADGWVDLLVTEDWGCVRWLANEGGRLRERTAEAGLSARRGWWNGIAAGDVDADGDLDYVTTNLGLNTRYRASSARPALAFVGSVEGGDRPFFVEATFDGDAMIPLRGRDALATLIPSIAARFPRYRDFATATLVDVLTPDGVKAARRFAVDTLESGVWLNDGRGRFAFRPLPRLAQIAPGFGVVLADFDADGHLDLALAQNFHGPQPETGRMDGGLGLLLRGDGRGDFEPVWPRESGLRIPADAKSMAVVDLNLDGAPDLIVGSNNGPSFAFENARKSGNRRLTVEVHGGPGNPGGVGAFVRVVGTDGRTRVAEVQAGGGYLSQSTARLHFGLGTNAGPVSIEVRWPGGRARTVEVSAEVERVRIAP